MLLLDISSHFLSPLTRTCLPPLPRPSLPMLSLSPLYWEGFKPPASGLHFHPISPYLPVSPFLVFASVTEADLSSRSDSAALKACVRKHKT